MFKKTEDYYFSPTALTISQSPYKGDSDYLIVSVRNGSKIRLSGLVPTANPLYDGNSGYNRKIGYNVDNLDAREWTFVGGNIKLSSAYKDLPLYIYIRLDASLLGTTGELFFSRNNYDFDGYPIPMGPNFDGKFTEEGEPAYSIPNLYSGNEKDYLESIANVDANDYINVAAEDLPSPKDNFTRFFVCIGILSDGKDGTRTWLPWNADAKGGTFLTDMSTEKGDGLFYLDNQLINQKYPFRSVITRALHLGNWTSGEDGDQEVTRIISTTNMGKIPHWFTDTYLATTAFIQHLFQNFGSRFLRKDQDDSTPFNLTVRNLHVESSDGSEIQKRDDFGNPLYYVLDEEGNPTTEETTLNTGHPIYVEFDDSLSSGKVSATSLDLKGIQPAPDDDSIIPSIEVGAFDQGVTASGAAIWIDSQGYSHIETDYANFRESMTAKSVEIEDVYHVGGQMLLTSASCIADMVVPYYQNGSSYSPNPPSPESGVGAAPVFYRVYFLRQDQTGKIVQNKWKVRDQAYCNQFNLEPTEGNKEGTHRYWRLVIATDLKPLTTTEFGPPVHGGASATVPDASPSDSTVFEVDSVEYNISDYHYIDLSNHYGSTPEDQWMQSAVMDTPLSEDNIVQLGFNTVVPPASLLPFTAKDASERSNAITIAGAGESSPSIIEYTNIHWWTLATDNPALGDKCASIAVRLAPNANYFSGKMEIGAGSSWTDLPSNIASSADFNALQDLYNSLNQHYADLQKQLATLGVQSSDNSEKIQNALDLISQIEGYQPNLLRNSGFIGDYVATQVDELLDMDGSTLISSNHLAYYRYANVKVWSGNQDDPMYDDPTDASLYSDYGTDASSRESRHLAVIGTDGYLEQSLYYQLIPETPYAFAFDAKKEGSNNKISVTVGSHTQEFTLTDSWTRYEVSSGTDRHISFPKGSQPASIIRITGKCRIACLQLEKAMQPSGWGTSYLDNATVMANFQSLMYLYEAVSSNKTQVSGGLVLTSLLQLGQSSVPPNDPTYWDNWSPTAGVNGVTGSFSISYPSDINEPITIANDCPAFWAGGNLEAAQKTINDYLRNETGSFSPSQLRSQASIVLTHGGRAILNDAVVRGDIYANNLFLGADQATVSTKFGKNGQLVAKDADIEGKITATDGSFKGKVEATEGSLGTMTLDGSLTLLGADGSLMTLSADSYGYPRIRLKHGNGLLDVMVYEGHPVAYWQNAHSNSQLWVSPENVRIQYEGADGEEYVAHYDPTGFQISYTPQGSGPFTMWSQFLNESKGWNIYKKFPTGTCQAVQWESASDPNNP